MFTKLTPEVYYATNTPATIGSDSLDFLRKALPQSTRQRTRICTHKDTGEPLHEMFVIYKNSTYVRPNCHHGKDESLIVLKGQADVIFFDELGTVTSVVQVGDYPSGKAFYCRIPREIWHTVIIRSDEIILFEATPGPFNPAHTTYAKWAPPESEETSIHEYIAALEQSITPLLETERKLLTSKTYETVSSNVYKSKQSIVPFSKTDCEFLLNELATRKLDRIRICAHLTDEDKLHEMLMSFSKTTYIRPSLHLNKEESILFLDGFGTYFFFDGFGNVMNKVRLGPQGSGRQFYCRVPANTYHALVLESETITVKETTSGPFRRDDTLFAAWSPEMKNKADVEAYLTKLTDLLD